VKLDPLRKTGGTSTPGKLTRRLIEHSLATALENDPELIVPRFTDLYDTTGTEEGLQRESQRPRR
jgi:hypothetical protein